jgi:DNA-binding transcriptional regulator YiaG
MTGIELRAKRQIKGVAKRRFARMLGISEDILRDIELGKIVPESPFFEDAQKLLDSVPSRNRRSGGNNNDISD